MSFPSRYISLVIVCSLSFVLTAQEAASTDSSSYANRNEMSEFILKEFVVTAKAGRRRKSAANQYIRQVIAHKNDNRPESNLFLSYEKYDEKLFSVCGITPRFKQRKLFKSFRFAFEHTDTTTWKGKEILPVFARETLSDVHYRRFPQSEKETVTADNMVEIRKYVDNEGIRKYMQHLYPDISIYDDNINFLSHQFLSPLSEIAPAFYNFSLADTVVVGTDSCVQLLFSPRFKGDLLFEGRLFVRADSSYAVRRAELRVGENVNVNWVKEAQIVQEFEKTPSGGWLPLFSHEDVVFQLARHNKMGVLGQRRVSFRNFSTNKLDKSVFAKPAFEQADSARLRSNDFWQQNRYAPLTKQTGTAYYLADTIQRVPAFRRAGSLINLLVSNYLDLGKFEIGAVTSFYRYNAVEGPQLRFGGRTTPELHKRLLFEGNISYGFRDEKLKGYAGATWAFASKSLWEFPVKSLHASFKYESFIPGTDYYGNHNEDRVFRALVSSPDNMRIYAKTLLVEHLNEFQNHLSYTAGFFYQEQTPARQLFFNTENYSEQRNTTEKINTSEFYLRLRYAPNEKIYVGRNARRRIPTASPVFTLQYNVGQRLWGNDYNYHKLVLLMEKRFFIPVVGYSDVALEGGWQFGTVPFPLLKIHRGNQTYSNQFRAYNQMNWLEFVSDRYVTLYWEHCFNGFLFNKIPLVRRLKLREFIGCKLLWGGLSKQNNPQHNAGLFRFPTNADGVPVTHALGAMPYIEASIGIGNILKFFRIDLVKRFTYLNNPNVQEYGVRMRLWLDF